jgi:hypothetical protein
MRTTAARRIVGCALDRLIEGLIPGDVKREAISKKSIRDRFAHAGARDAIRPHAVERVARTKKSPSRRVTLEAL